MCMKNFIGIHFFEKDSDLLQKFIRSTNHLKPNKSYIEVSRLLNDHYCC
jgi:hypothetical protein